MRVRGAISFDLIASASVVAVMAAVSALGFRGIFPDWSFLPAAAIAVVAATVMMFAGRWLGLSSPESLLLSLIAFVIFGAIAAEGVPTIGAYSTFFDGLTEGWAQALTSSPPADLTGEFRVLPYTVAWFGTMIGGELLRSKKLSGLAALGPVAALIFSLLITLEDRQIALLQGSVAAVGTLLLGFMQQRRRTQHAELFEDQTIERPKSIAGFASAIAMTMVIASLAPFLGPRLPFASSNERFDLRQYQVPPFDPLKNPSPLTEIKAALNEKNADKIVFRVISSQPVLRFPVAILDHYNGEFWAVANEEGDAAGEFRPVDSTFPEPRDASNGERELVTATIEIVDFDKLVDGDFDPAWLPTLGWPVSLTSDVSLDVRFNVDTGTVALAPDGPSKGLIYEVVSAVPPAINQLNLRASTITKVDVIDLALPQMISFASDVIEGSDVGWEQIEAIRTRFVDAGFYDSREDSATGRSGHRQSRLAEFTNTPERLVGFEEQYAATAALIARSEGIPVRVVVGYRINDDEADERWAGNRLDVVADDMSAWIEVNFDDIGWVPFDVTPPRERAPEDVSSGRSQREVAIPNPPPDPPPPVVPPQLDRDIDLEEEDEDEEDKDEEESDDSGSGIDAGDVIFAAAATSPATSLIGGGLLVVALKRRRTRRRRLAKTPSLRVAGAWHEVVDRYEELGASPRSTATPQEFSRGLHAAELVGKTDEVLLLDLARAADAAAYHPRPASTIHADAAWQKTDALVQSIGDSQNWFRRVRHRLDPRPLFRRDPLMVEEGNDE